MPSLLPANALVKPQVERFFQLAARQVLVLSSQRAGKVAPYRAKRVVMQQVARETWAAFERRLQRAGVPAPERPQFHKWSRFYLDFCRKYGHPPRSASSLEPFLMKLAAKNQSVVQRDQASSAVRLLIGPSPQPPPRRVIPVTARQRTAAGVQGDSAPIALPKAVAQPPRAAALAPAGAHSRPPALSAPLQFEVPSESPRLSAASVHPLGRGVSWQREYADMKAAILMRNY